MVIDNMSQRQVRERRSYAFVTKLIPGLQALTDSAALLGAGYVSLYFLVTYSYKTIDFYHFAVIFNWLATMMVAHFAGLYQFDAILKPRYIQDRVIIAIITAFLLMFAAAFTLKISDVYSRVWIAIFFLGSIGAVTAERYGISLVLKSLVRSRTISRRVAIFGRATQISQFFEFAEKPESSIMKIAAVFLEDGEQSPGQPFAPLVRGGLEELIAFTRSNTIDDIIVALPWSEAARIKQLMLALRELPTNVLLSADLAGYSVRMGPPPGYYDTAPLFQLAGKPLSEWDVVIKAVTDYCIAALLLAALSPLLLIVALLIKLDSPGPVLFRQQRLGFNNRRFNIYKFRSMVHAPQPAAATVQAAAGDRRITRLGRLLRTSSIDELPQLLNVLNGTMSLVGPRPHAVDHNEDYAKKIRFYFARHRVKPGITGLAQVKGFRGPTETVAKMEQRVKYDIEYTETWSPALDLKILLMTPYSVIIGTNAV